ncbi:hypothetical protein [Leuconostoc holzapfelii]
MVYHCTDPGFVISDPITTNETKIKSRSIDLLFD